MITKRQEEIDTQYMRMALRLAVRARGMTSPNPMVGAVIVRNSRLIGRGFHKSAGLPHAEIDALMNVGSKAKGSTLYVNLEPCCHTIKRTPPCVKEIIERGVKRVVVAMEDPNPHVSGRGFSALERAGVKVTTGILRDDAERLNEAYIKYITTGRPFVILKVASSLDGKVATATGESRWISGEKARDYVHRLRSTVDAIMVGIGTILSDNPLLTARPKTGKVKNPIRIVVDSRLKIPDMAKVLSSDPSVPTIIATTEQAPIDRVKELEEFGAKVLVLDSKDDRVDLGALMKRLGEIEIISLLIEGGPEVSASALREGVVDKVIFIIAPKIIGGDTSKGSIGGEGIKSLKDSIPVKDIKIKRIGEDMVVEGYIERSHRDGDS